MDQFTTVKQHCTLLHWRDILLVVLFCAQNVANLYSA